METINGCTVIPQPETSEPITLGPAEMDGAYRVLVGLFPAGEPGPPLHIHPHTDETFYVAAGEATFLLGDRELALSTGGLVFVPRGVPHTVRNSGDVPVHGMLVISPGNAEHVFEPVDAS